MASSAIALAPTRPRGRGRPKTRLAGQRVTIHLPEPVRHIPLRREQLAHMRAGHAPSLHYLLATYGQEHLSEVLSPWSITILRYYALVAGAAMGRSNTVTVANIVAAVGQQMSAADAVAYVVQGGL